MMLKFRLPRRSDPSVVVDVVHEDIGDSMPGIAADGSTFRAYTSRITINGVLFLSQVSANFGDKEEIARIRMVEDMALLESQDVNTETMMDQLNDA